MGAMIDKTGMRFGRLTVLREAPRIEPGRPRWVCQCDCGTIVTVDSRSLSPKRTKSCGCINSERARKLALDHITHGQTKTRLYNIWYNMRNRCNKKSAVDYCRYGGRGIEVCEAWQNSFTPFFEWAMANGYRDDLTLDRIDNNGNYCPENCRWADSETQNNNRRSNHYITYSGETLTVSQWARRLGINKVTLQSRLSKYGWSVQKTFTENRRNNK